MPYTPKGNFPMIAAIDLGSNSFHMVLARVEGEEIRILERWGEKVQLAAGLDKSRHLKEDAINRGWACLARMAQLVSEMAPGSVRVVGTNSLREAKNADQFIHRAEKILGHPVEIISGQEEARLIHLGVCQSMPLSSEKRLVIDVGGGSTEFIIGRGFNPLLRESLHIGCVRFTQNFFMDGIIHAARYKDAYTAARIELMPIEQNMLRLGWQQAVGSSGTFKACGLAMMALGFGQGEITRQGLTALKMRLLKLKTCNDIVFEGVKPDRRGVFPAGVAIVDAIFDALNLDKVMFCDGALREGVLYDLLGRHHHEDVRERTLKALQSRYHIDLEQAVRVEAYAMSIFDQVADKWQIQNEGYKELLRWAACIHEVGLDIAHEGYHKHGAYLIEHSDLPGFSRQDQQLLAWLVRCQRRKLSVDKTDVFLNLATPLVRICIVLRLAILFCHIRRDLVKALDFKINVHANHLEVHFHTGWLKDNPLTHADFEVEAEWLKKSGYELTVT